MNCNRKNLALILILIIIISNLSLIIVKPANAHSIPKPLIPEFTIKIVDHSYDVPASVTTTIDPYNNKTITRTFPATHVQNISVDLTVSNQAFPATIDGNASFLSYNLRTKPHFGENWVQNYDETTKIGLLTSQSSSQYTVLLSSPVDDFKVGDQIDYQVKAILGYQYTTFEHLEHLDPGYHGPYPVPVSHTVFVESSDWSPTQTFIMPDISSTPTPFQQNIVLILIFAILVVLIVFSLLVFRRHRKTTKEFKVKKL